MIAKITDAIFTAYLPVYRVLCSSTCMQHSLIRLLYIIVKCWNYIKFVGPFKYVHISFVQFHTEPMRVK